MFNFIRAEIYRIKSKKMFWIYFGIMYGLFTTIILASSGFKASTDFLEIGEVIIMAIFAMFAGTYIYLTVFSDDVSSRSITNTISSGMSRTSYIFGRILVAIITITVVYLLGALVFFGNMIYAVGFDNQTAHVVEVLAKQVGLNIIALLVYMTLSASVVYLTKKTQMGVVVYSGISLGFFGQILLLLSKIKIFNISLSFLDKISLTEAYKKVVSSVSMNHFDWSSFSVMGIYLLIGVTLSIVALKKMDMDIE